MIARRKGAAHEGRRHTGPVHRRFAVVSAARSSEDLVGLVATALREGEGEWREFKRNNADPQEIGEYFSALANAAALNEQPCAYMFWGVDDATRKPVGTDFDPHSAKKGNEPLEIWLQRELDPKTGFRFHDVNMDGGRVVVAEIDVAAVRPVRFRGTAHIRVGAVKKPLAAAPERERELWRVLGRPRFETTVARERLSAEDVLRLLDYPIYFKMLELPLPQGPDRTVEALAADGLIRRGPAGGWDVVNLGAILLAARLDDFPGLERKAIRVIRYRGGSRIETVMEKLVGKGYAAGFEESLGHIDALLPGGEAIENGLRTAWRGFPPVAVRELVSNMLIHQDFSVSGAGPMVEIFDDRIELSNPGAPLVLTDRFVDAPPRSRNEATAALMRRFGVCEERGSGIDKVVFAVEQAHLPAPLFDAPEGFTRTALFTRKNLKDMDRAEKIRATYLHSCIQYVTNERATNATLRNRFGIADRNAAVATRLLNDAVDAGMIAIADSAVGYRRRAYLPFWAAGRTDETGTIV